MIKDSQSAKPTKAEDAKRRAEILGSEPFFHLEPMLNSPLSELGCRPRSFLLWNSFRKKRKRNNPNMKNLKKKYSTSLV